MRPLYESVKEDKSEADKMFEESGLKKQTWLSECENKIIYENDKKSRFIIFSKTVKAVECATEHGFSNYIYPHEFPAINQKCKELGWL